MPHNLNDVFVHNVLSAEHGTHAFHRALDVTFTVEGTDTDVAFAAETKSDAWGGDDAGFFQ